jgi:urease accessory protein
LHPWHLLQLADSAFPTGGFAHSAGLEAAMHHGRGRTPADLEAYLGEHLWNFGCTSLPFVAASFDAPAEVWTLDAWADATLTNHVANRASRTQGRTFVSTCAKIYEVPAVVALDARVRGKVPRVTAHFAPVFGACLAAIEASRDDTLALALFMALRGVTSAAVRLGVVGPHEAQRLQRRHAPTMDAVLAECATLPLRDVATRFPLLDTMQATHDRLYARLFQS